MPDTIVTALLWFGLVSCGLLAWLYFAFSRFIMTALGALERPAGTAAMNAINPRHDAVRAGPDRARLRRYAIECRTGLIPPG
ncbi:hypothetical protein FHS91_003188 [Sphingobium xanthum]|jgi:hypothetical protein|uniref:hypothetical protein n=1 Tax=Sphingobium xanthum TaxID=1387165 RepID=UPI001C8B19BA|nr:hypothetical protein [Sphingobium xanthum]